MESKFSQKKLITKPNSKKKKVILAIEIIMILVVAFGTIISFTNIQKISLGRVVNNVKGVFSIQKPDTQKGKTLTIEEKIKLSFKDVIQDIVLVEIDKENYIKISSKKGLRVIVANERDAEEQAQTLQNILSKAKIEDKKVSLVDFRFDKLVVRYSK